MKSTKLSTFIYIFHNKKIFKGLLVTRLTEYLQWLLDINSKSKKGNHQLGFHEIERGKETINYRLISKN